MGLNDVRVLAAELIKANNNKQYIGDLQILSRYQRRCKTTNAMMIAAIEGCKRIFTEQSLFNKTMRCVGMQQINQITPLKKLIIKQASGIY